MPGAERNSLKKQESEKVILARHQSTDSAREYIINEIPSIPGGCPFCFQMDGGFPGNNLDKDSRPSDPYPTGRHTRAPERTRKWRPDHREAIVPSVSMAMPVSGCHFTLSFLKWFKLSVT